MDDDDDGGMDDFKPEEEARSGHTVAWLSHLTMKAHSKWNKSIIHRRAGLIIDKNSDKRDSSSIKIPISVTHHR